MQWVLDWWQQLPGRFSLNLWKIVGLLGGLMFGLRWLVQARASKKAGRFTVPALFWYLSLLGAGMQTAYFAFYRVDSVGLMATLPPALIAAWNLKKFYLNQPPADKEP
jgi:lipid-A-disaccharide synthase-like uncharacterized protein